MEDRYVRRDKWGKTHHSSSVFQEKHFKESQASAEKFRDPCGRQWPSDFVFCFFFSIALARGFPGGTSGKEPTCWCKRCRRHRFNPGVGKIPWRRKWQPTLVFLPGEAHGQRSLAGYSPCGLQSVWSLRVGHNWRDLAHTQPLLQWSSPQSPRCKTDKWGASEVNLGWTSPLHHVHPF